MYSTFQIHPITEWIGLNMHTTYTCCSLLKVDRERFCAFDWCWAKLHWHKEVYLAEIITSLNSAIHEKYRQMALRFFYINLCASSEYWMLWVQYLPLRPKNLHCNNRLLPDSVVLLSINLVSLSWNHIISNTLLCTLSYKLAHFLSYTFAHLHGHPLCSRPITRMIKKLGLSYTCIKVVKNCQILTFKVNFLCQKWFKSFSFFFHWTIPL